MLDRADEQYVREALDVIFALLDRQESAVRAAQGGRVYRDGTVGPPPACDPSDLMMPYAAAQAIKAQWARGQVNRRQKGKR